ncbi:adenosine deaminase [Streptomyces sp. NPDC016309]|uniref:adenosine deaminase family protein n=1 Tax=Streptomyces sp. NPDC016309 TaxID=3364965 RepID=UPI0036F70FF1
MIPDPRRTARRRTARRLRTLLVPVVAALGLLGPPAPLPASAGPLPRPPAPRPPTAAEARTDALLRHARRDPRLLRDFFRRLPKGGDLHHHLWGAVTTEYLVRLAGDDGLCVDPSTMTAVPPPCGPGTRPAADARADASFRTALVRAWSMQDLPPGRNGHDHFFGTFGRFAEVASRHPGELLAEVAEKAAAGNQSYLETMVTPVPGAARELADDVGWDADLRRLYGRLTVGGRLDGLVAAARREADDADAGFRTAARCGTGRPGAACRLTVRRISQVARGDSPVRVFTQLALAMRLAERDARFVAVNLVQPEDEAGALAHYRLHMRMLRYLRGVHPRAHVTLHAGELWPGLAGPEHLAFHIREAVTVAGAERIGHGVGLVHEDDWRATARTMAAREVAVEVAFTSNAQILGVLGDDHPFATYRAHGVPVVLATDDPGVSRTDLGHEYQYAATAHGLSYPELKDLARASLEYAFLPGRSLWRGNPTAGGYRPVPACAGLHPTGGRPLPGPCRRLLATSPKAAVQWRQEAAFAAFERTARTGR